MALGDEPEGSIVIRVLVRQPPGDSLALVPMNPDYPVFVRLRLDDDDCAVHGKVCYNTGVGEHNRARALEG